LVDRLFKSSISYFTVEAFALESVAEISAAFVKLNSGRSEASKIEMSNAFAINRTVYVNNAAGPKT